MATYIVQKGDNLTHIARRFGVRHWRDIYEHPNNAEFRRKRPNPNLIYPGDLLFIPGQGGPAVVEMEEMSIIGSLAPDTPVKDLPDAERKKLTDEALKELPGDWKHFGEEGLKWISIGLTVGQLVELTTLIGSGAWLMASPLVLAVRSVLAWAAAWETNEKMYGFRGVAYTTTAWAYGKPRPTESPEMMRRFREWSTSPQAIDRRRRKWEELSQKYWQHWETAHLKHNVSKEVMQAALKLEGITKAKNSFGSPEEKLCLVMLQSFEDDFRLGTNRDSWKEGYRILYPR